jgi:predicted nucleotidyltransferase
MAAIFPDQAAIRARLQAGLERVVCVLRAIPEVRKVIAFGSLLGPRLTSTSDLDVMVIMDTPLRFLDRIDHLRQRLDPGCPMDLVVYTPAEFEEMLQWSDFVQTAVKTGQVVYESRPGD